MKGIDIPGAMLDEKRTGQKRSTRSPETRALMSESAKKLGKMRSDGVRERVQKAMLEIEHEMVDNEGIYPHNKGAVSAAEVARRADVHQTTFFSPNQAELGSEVRTWLKRIKQGKIVGRGRVHRAMADRVSDWKKIYNGLAQSHRDTELELQQTQADLGKAHDQIQQLKAENDQLRKMLQTTGAAKLLSLPIEGKE
jgi:hypothetical protein